MIRLSKLGPSNLKLGEILWSQVFQVFRMLLSKFLLGRVTQSVAGLTQEQEVPGLIHGPASYFVSASAVSRTTVPTFDILAS